MGVYIKGMEMPETCIECMNSGLRTAIRCTEWTKISAGFRENHRSISCHLTEVPEPHGDLVDRDILEQELINGIKAGNLEEGYEHYANINNMDDCVECVKYADTIIKADTP